MVLYEDILVVLEYRNSLENEKIFKNSIYKKNIKLFILDELIRLLYEEYLKVPEVYSGHTSKSSKQIIRDFMYDCIEFSQRGSKKARSIFATGVTVSEEILYLFI